MDAPVATQRFERDAVTRAAYLMLGLWGFLLYALGPALPALREQLDLSRAAVSLHTTLVAVGAIFVGLVGDRIVDRLGRRRSFWSAAAGIAIGAAVLAGGGRIEFTLLGALVLGLAGALQVALVQSTLADRHGPRAATALVESSALGVALGAVAPFVIALAIIAGGDWRWVFFGAAAVAVPVVAFVYRSVAFPLPPEIDHDQSAALPWRYWLHWCALLLFIGVEFCIAFWATDFLETEHVFSGAAAAGSASLLLVGMTVGRVVGGRLALRVAPARLLFAALPVAGAGFLGFWLLDGPLPVLAGLLVAGLGMALLYPLTFALAVDSAAGRTEAASARSVFAAGIAVALAPFALGALADGAGLKTAYGIVPVLLAAGAAMLLVARRDSRTKMSACLPSASGPPSAGRRTRLPGPD